MGPVEHDCAHADEHPVIDPAPVEDCPVAYGHVVSDECREPFARMDNTIVLDIRAITDHDPVLVSPDHGPEPDSHVTADRDIAYDRGIGCPE
jgi:hypothetical protein